VKVVLQAGTSLCHYPKAEEFHEVAIDHRYPKLSISGFEITVNVWDFPYWYIHFENIEIKSTFKLH
jgi:hypothetical protein